MTTTRTRKPKPQQQEQPKAVTRWPDRWPAGRWIEVSEHFTTAARAVGLTVPVVVDLELHAMSDAKHEQNMAYAYVEVFGYTEAQVKEWRAAYDGPPPDLAASPVIHSSLDPDFPEPATWALDAETAAKMAVVEAAWDEQDAEAEPS